ncbi:MAG: NTP transferase domain-containing protein [Clostridia bacterium]|nr:NTP transferase domain-containing protein [Clostridia bacterium]
MMHITSDAVLRAFHASGKRHLIVTGGRKSGKTTLLNELISDPMPGVVTWAVPKSAVYLRDGVTGETAQVGVFDESIPGEENRMRLIPDGFTETGIPALTRDGDWLKIDEIGYLETECEPYCEALLRVFGEKRVIAAVRKQDIPFLSALCRRDDVFTVDLDHPYGNLGCVIMASGEGKRFGSNKLTAQFLGRPLIQHAIEATDGIFSRRVVVTRHLSVAELCRENGIDVILHDLPYRSDTVRLGIEMLADTDGCLFCQGDQPLLSRETVSAMALSAVNDPSSIFRASYGGVGGSPVLFPQWTYGELADLPEGKGGGVLVKKYPGSVKHAEVRDPAELRDCDTLEDLAELERTALERIYTNFL